MRSSKELFVSRKVPNHMFQGMILSQTNMQQYICFNDIKINLDPSNTVRYVPGTYFN